MSLSPRLHHKLELLAMSHQAELPCLDGALRTFYFVRSVPFNTVPVGALVYSEGHSGAGIRLRADTSSKNVWSFCEHRPFCFRGASIYWVEN